MFLSLAPEAYLLRILEYLTGALVDQTLHPYQPPDVGSRRHDNSRLAIPAYRFPHERSRAALRISEACFLVTTPSAFSSWTAPRTHALYSLWPFQAERPNGSPREQCW